MCPRLPVLPPILFRWIDDDQARSLLIRGGLCPSWTHLSPDSGRREAGICFGEDPLRWRATGSYTTCIAISTEGLESAARPIKLNGNLAFELSHRHLHLAKRAAASRLPEERRSHLDAARLVASDLRKRHLDGSAAADEWFLRSAVRDALPRMRGVVMLAEAGRDVEILVERALAARSLRCATHRVPPDVADDPGRLELHLATAFQGLMPTAAGNVAYAA